MTIASGTGLPVMVSTTAPEASRTVVGSALPNSTAAARSACNSVRTMARRLRRSRRTTAARTRSRRRPISIRLDRHQRTLRCATQHGRVATARWRGVVEQQHAEVLGGNVWRPRIPGWRDLAATSLLLGSVVLLGVGARAMVGPFAPEHALPISLSPTRLPYYTLRTITRMLAALVASLIFTFTYATLAAKSRRAGKVLIPVLDVLQSVPILGYLSVTVVFFVALFPGNVLGPELAAVFAIFTSQAWNMAFSFYQSLSTVPTDLDEASRSLRASGWQRFWRLEVPFAMPGLIWNMMMSMSGGWFFVVASEAISVGSLQIALPGVGSYVARAIQQHDLAAVGWAIVAMTIAIVLYDQLLFRPLVAWADKFRVEQTAAGAGRRSWVLDVFRRATFVHGLAAPITAVARKAARARPVTPWHRLQAMPWSFPPRLADTFWLAALILVAGGVAWGFARFAGSALSPTDVKIAFADGGLTLLRVAVLIALASIVWVPVGVAVGLRPT
ncbi:MAG TPA: ABC transporter permease subunit, partial [Rhodanobacteraceae bacterium]|nr:ABC transporter permease subunit [Rhodanobacteraceae bacterium]